MDGTANFALIFCRPQKTRQTLKGCVTHLPDFFYHICLCFYCKNFIRLMQSNIFIRYQSDIRWRNF